MKSRQSFHNVNIILAYR